MTNITNICGGITLFMDSFSVSKTKLLKRSCLNSKWCVYIAVFSESSQLCHLRNANKNQGIVALYAAHNPFLLNKICLNQIKIRTWSGVCVFLFRNLSSDLYFGRLLSLPYHLRATFSKGREILLTIFDF